nr:hypothetical protein [Tanacetum cinerariifolium]
MLMTMKPEIQRNLEPLHAHQMLRELKTLFSQQAEQELLLTTRDFHSCKQEEEQPVSSYVLKMKGYIENLERLGHPVTLGLGTVNELHVMQKLHEQTLPKKRLCSKCYSSWEDPEKDSICHECGEIGQWKRNCPQYLAELLKKKKNAASRAGGSCIFVIELNTILNRSWIYDTGCAELLKKKKNAASRAGGSGIFVIELNTILNRSWIYDTGCGTHICNAMQGLRASRKLKLGALSLYVGNGQREAVEAIRAFYLCLLSGLEIVLNNCYYASFINRGVISVSRLYEDGFVNRFMDNTIQVSRNNVVYFSAVLMDGIFEIDLSNSLTNESSIYVVSNKRAKLDLDSALLWHCRLGHISKKRTKKLQHDGLLDSSDLRVFEKYVSCMSRNMARKPYTHQVERAKDLLGLIHTDEVENQLGKTIKSLHLDRGGEYMSQEFLDHLKDHGIIAHRTPHYTPQHNDVSERRNKTILDMVKWIKNEAKAGIFGFVAIKSAQCSKSRQSREKSLSMPWKRAQKNESNGAFGFYWASP